VLLVKRHGNSGFMAGAHVFPGGRVDDGDHDVTWPNARALLDGMDERSASGFVNAAVRETREEANIDVDGGALHPWAWWITPAEEPKRFDTRFFLCAVPPETHATVDAHETVAHVWLTPKDALLAYARGEMALAPPTMCTLEDLAPYASVEAAARSVARPVRPTCPRVVQDDAGLVLALPGDPLHPVKERVFPHRTRIVLGLSGRFASACVPAKESA
jgi:8-oxo-dGTP pyrophosphatase MutT (NUDIX family)